MNAQMSYIFIGHYIGPKPLIPILDFAYLIAYETFRPFMRARLIIIILFYLLNS